MTVVQARGGAVPADGALFAHGEGIGPPSAATLLGGGHWSWLAVGLLVVAGGYLVGVHLLRVQGVRWPWGRVVCFLGPGLGGIAVVTVTGVETYDTTLLSVHMLQHMMLSMVAPIFLALGAPVTLALRTLPPRGRRLLTSVLHSRVVRVLAFPLVAYGIFVASPFILYFSGLYPLSLRSTAVHEVVHLHFLLSGCLFLWPLIGLDPLPGRWPYPARALLMFLSAPLHAVLGLTIMQSRELLGGDWYPALGLAWADPAADQRLAGGLLWAGGELVSVTMLAVLLVQWMRHADREARRVDRQLDRQEAAERAAAAHDPAVVRQPDPGDPAVLAGGSDPVGTIGSAVAGRQGAPAHD